MNIRLTTVLSVLLCNYNVSRLRSLWAPITALEMHRAHALMLELEIILLLESHYLLPCSSVHQLHSRGIGTGL